VVGATFAFAHLFVAYEIPTKVPYLYSLGDLTSGIASDVSSAASTATASASAGIGKWLKKVAFRAAGEEGLAENVRNEEGKPFGIDAIHAAKDLKAREEIRYRDEYRLIHCTDTSGQLFAILINCLYLAPLTWLFVRFFIRSYTKQGESPGKTSQRRRISSSGKDAMRDVQREIEQAFDEKSGSADEETASTSGEASSKDKDTTENKQDTSDSKDDTKTQDKKDGAKTQDKKDDPKTQDKKDDPKTQDKKDDPKTQDKKDDPKTQDKKDDPTTQDKKDDSEKQDKKNSSEKTDQDEAKAEDKNDEDKEDIDILDSSEAVTDELDKDMAEVSKELGENGKSR
jgi:GNS1/SUR4 family